MLLFYKIVLEEKHIASCTLRATRAAGQHPMEGRRQEWPHLKGSTGVSYESPEAYAATSTDVILYDCPVCGKCIVKDLLGKCKLDVFMMYNMTIVRCP